MMFNWETREDMAPLGNFHSSAAVYSLSSAHWDTGKLVMAMHNFYPHPAGRDGIESVPPGVYLSSGLPTWMVRFAEPREYSCFGAQIHPWNCVERRLGSLTVDNQTYGRYSGEVQMLRGDFPADPGGNVVGHVAAPCLPLASCVKRGASFALTPWS